MKKLALAAAIILAALSLTAAALAAEQSYTYFSGYVAPQTGKGYFYDTVCKPVFELDITNSPVGWRKTAVLINTSGSWVRRADSTAAAFGVVISPITQAEAQRWRKKPFCKNNENAYTFSMACTQYWYVTGLTCN